MSLSDIERQPPLPLDVAVEEVDTAKDERSSRLAFFHRREREASPNQPNAVDRPWNLERRSERCADERIQYIVRGALDRVDRLVSPRAVQHHGKLSFEESQALSPRRRTRPAGMARTFRQIIPRQFSDSAHERDEHHAIGARLVLG